MKATATARNVRVAAGNEDDDSIPVEEEPGQAESEQGPSSALAAPSGDNDASRTSPKEAKHTSIKAGVTEKRSRSSTQSTGSKGRVRGEIRYPISDVEPSSPRVVLSMKYKSTWRQRVHSACALSTSTFQRQITPLDADADDQAAAMDLLTPSLGWYADQLSVACGRALLPTSACVLALQSHQSSGYALLNDGEQWWPLLLETVSLFAASAYHVHRAAEILGTEVGGRLNRHGSTSTEGSAPVAAHGGASDSGFPHRMPMPPFAPKGAAAALADLHLSVAKLQSAGPQLAAALKRLAQGNQIDPVKDLEALLDSLPSRGGTGGFGDHCFVAANAGDEKWIPKRLQMLFMAVPCIEEAMDKLGLLLSMVERSLAVQSRAVAKAGQPSRKKQGSGTSANDDDEDFIVEDDGEELDVIHEDSQEVTERLSSLDMIPEANKLSAKATARPASARRRPGSGSSAGSDKHRGQESSESNTQPQTPQQATPPNESAEMSKKGSEPSKSSKEGKLPPSGQKSKKKKGS